MAKPTKKQRSSTAKSSPSTKVTRISATDDAPKKKSPSKATKPQPKTAAKTADMAAKRRFALPKRIAKSGEPKQRRGLAGYFAGAWHELGQVRWPDRHTTWSMTGALLAFTAFFVVLVILIDMGFKYLFELMIGR